MLNQITVEPFNKDSSAVIGYLNHTAARALDLFGLHVDIPRWKEVGSPLDRA